jgi:hypothetical protein
MRLRIKYCGGCNEKYSRRRLGEEIIGRAREKLGNSELVIANEDADVTLYLCGCEVCCVDDDQSRRERRVVVGPGLVDYLELKPEDVADYAAEKIVFGG